MSDHSKIEWTDATWNPTRGCSLVSEGCRNCYAMHWAHRFSGPGQPYHGLVTESGKWNGNMRLVRPMLTKPFSWKRPRRIFVNSMSDLFHEGVIWDWLDEVFAVMYACQWHTFQVLTKRPERMREYIALSRPINRIAHKAWWLLQRRDTEKAKIVSPEDIAADLFQCWPLPNVHLGVSIEDQATADARIPHLVGTPAAVRFVSAEPLLGPVDLRLNSDAVPCNQYGIALGPCGYYCGESVGHIDHRRNRIDGVIVGGESGPHARPMHPDWARSLRDQCQVGGAAFFFKQWGEWSPAHHCWSCQADGETVLAELMSLRRRYEIAFGGDCSQLALWKHRNSVMIRGGKQKAGRMLDGRTWDELPEVSHA